MTSQYPTQPGWATQTPPAPQPPKRRSRRTAILMASAAAILGLLVLGRLTEDPATTTTPAPAARANATAATSPPAPEPTFDTPALADFKLTVKELTRQRFGSAGDLVDYRVQLVQVRDRSYDPDKEYELTYRITGGESGAETQTMLVRGDEYEAYEGNASTRGGVKVKATPTSIEEV